MALPLAQMAAEKLQGAGNLLRRSKVVVGLDGFVDTILHVVDKRQSPTKYTRLRKMMEFGDRIRKASAKSANFELVTQVVKLGGNGPIMANAMRSFGSPLTYIGNLGRPEVHPVFADLAAKVDVHSIAEPALTSAIEFDDGKLMLGQHDSLREVNWKNLTKHLSVPVLRKLFGDASLIALVNWTMLTRKTAILKKLLSEVAPHLKGPKRWLFFDLADPAKRPLTDIRSVLRTISRFEKTFHVILGLNFSESCQIGHVLGLRKPAETEKSVAGFAGRIRDKLKIHTVVIHPVTFAAAANESRTIAIPGPHYAKPKISTGAGDHFNAGFCLGRLLKGDLALSLQYGVSTSGFYVSNARSPRLEDLARYLRTL